MRYFYIDILYWNHSNIVCFNSAQRLGRYVLKLNQQVNVIIFPLREFCLSTKATAYSITALAPCNFESWLGVCTFHMTRWKFQNWPHMWSCVFTNVYLWIEQNKEFKLKFGPNFEAGGAYSGGACIKKHVLKGTGDWKHNWWNHLSKSFVKIVTQLPHNCFVRKFWTP